MDWPPSKLPKNFPLTVRADGYCKKINGSVRWICGRIPPRQAVERLHERIRNGDFDAKPPPVMTPLSIGEDLSVKELSNLYMAWLRQRVDTRRPRPLASRTYDDIRIAVQLFSDTRWEDHAGQLFRLAQLPAVELGPGQFSAFAARIPGQSPNTRARYIAYVTSMFRWGVEADHLAHPVKFGPDFKKPAAEEIDIARADLAKAFSVQEIRQMLQWTLAAKAQANLRARRRAWLLCGLNFAFSNIDIARFCGEHLDRRQNVVAMRRGKKKRAYRKSIVMPITLWAIDQYRRPAAAATEHQPLLFLTDRGLPLVRSKEKRTSDGQLLGATRIDALGEDFIEFMKAAGVRAQKRNFSGLRTTFRTIVEAMAAKDNDAIDLVMGHSRRHISRHYVETFPVEKLHAVVSFLWGQLFDGWSVPLNESPQARDDAPPCASGSAAA